MLMLYSPLLVLAIASSTYAYTLQNVTVGSADKNIQYYPPCVEADARACPGAWWKAYDSRFYNGSAMVCGDPTKYFGDVEPYLSFSFQGSGLWMYQWMNLSTATQLQYYDNSKNPYVNLTQQYAGQLGSELQPVLAWSLTGLDPLKTHTVGIQQFADANSGKDTFIFFDYMIISKTILDASDTAHQKSKTPAIVGGIIGGLLGLVAIILGFIVLRNCRRQREVAARGKGRYAWQATAEATPNTIKFVDPSSEIEASERIAREGRLEEELEKAHKLGGEV